MGACQCNQSYENDEFSVSKTIEEPQTSLPRINIVKVMQHNHMEEEVHATNSPFTPSKRSSRLSFDNLMSLEQMALANGMQQRFNDVVQQTEICRDDKIQYGQDRINTDDILDYDQINSFVIKRDDYDLGSSPASQGKTTAEIHSRSRTHRPNPVDNYQRLCQLRLKETEYTKEELTFMYMMHNQTFNKRENLQNPVTVEEMQVRGNPQKWKKRLVSNLDSAQRAVFDEVRRELDNDGLMHVSNNQVLRAMTVSPTKTECIQTIRKTEENRINLNLNDLQESDFEDLIRMNCFVDNGSYDKEGRPILYLLMRNINLRKVSVEHFMRFWVFVSDRACYRMSNCTDELLIIVDFKGFGFSQIYTNHFKAAINILQEVYCGRNSFVKIVNGGKILNSLKSLLLKFFSESAKEDLQILDKNFKEQILHYVEPQFLPVEYGGTMPSLT